MGRYYRNRRGYYQNRRGYNSYDGEGILCFVLLVIIVNIINFIIKNYKIIILIIVIITILFLLFRYRYKIFDYFRNKEIKKIKYKSLLYFNIVRVNQKYHLESLGNFYSQYYVRFKSNLNTCNIDDYLLYTIKEQYDELKQYKLKYDYIKNEYHKYEKEYEELRKYINDEDASKLKIKKNKYYKYQLELFEQNKKRINYEFNVIIYINYQSRKGKVQANKHKTYNKFEFTKIMDEYFRLKKEKKLLEITSRIERSKVSESLRYDVFKRDNFKCKICGMSAKDGATLHLDHIIPISKGGKTEMRNLQTLCSRCNIGKSNKL